MIKLVKHSKSGHWYIALGTSINATNTYDNQDETLYVRCSITTILLAMVLFVIQLGGLINIPYYTRHTKEFNDKFK